MKKQWLALLLALVMVLGVVALTSTNVQADDSISLMYDDRKDLSELLGKAVTDVSITDQNVTSSQVGSDVKDTNVLLYEDSILYAVGTGTATLTVNGVAYHVTVKAAPISLFMITGHSVGAGQNGTASQSVAVEAGQAYSSYYYKSLNFENVDGYGLGYGSVNRVGVAGQHQYSSEGSLDAFAPGNGGTTSTSSALVYQWNQLTGEKVWVLNAAVPGSCINEWQEGHSGHHTSGAYAYNYYDKAVEMYQYAQTILKNEIAAGHYTLSHMAIAYFNGTNFSNASYTDWTLDSLKGHYEGMWNGFKTAFTTDMDGDGNTETVEALGIVPFWSLSSLNYSGDKAATYYMAASQEWPDVFTLSDIYRDWMTVDGIKSSFPAIDYATNSGEAVQAPTAVKNTAMDATNGADWSVFCSKDNTHLSQVAYNAVGFDMGSNLYQYLCQDVTAASGHFEDVSGNSLDSYTVTTGEQKSIVPVVEPLNGKKVTLEAAGAVSLNGNCVVANKAGSGTVTMSIDGTVVDTITVTVAEHMDHCACGGHANGMKNHTCSTLTGWKAWGNTDAEMKSLPTTTGNYYLVSDITLTEAKEIPAGASVNLCLNSYDITTSANARLISQKGKLSITDCGEEANWGTMHAKITANYSPIMYTYATAVTNVYAGNLDGSASTIAQGGAVIVQGGTFNMYGGNITGTALTLSNSNLTETRGGVFYVISSATLNIYGGTVTGGSSANNGGGIHAITGTYVNIYGGTITGNSATANGGNIHNEGTLKIEGGTISDGIAKQGANVFNGKTMTMSGGTISGGEASAYGGAICVKGGYTFTMTGGTITGGYAATGGGNICALPGATVSISQANGKTTKISDGIVADGTTGNGGNIYCGSNSTSASVVTMSGGTMSGGKAKSGGNIYAQSNVTVAGGTVSKGVASEYGGNVYVSGIFAVTGGTVSGGTAVNGGNIYSKGNTTVSGGTISGGQASSCGGNIYQYNTANVTLTIAGGTISGGKTTATVSGNNGGNIYIHGVNDNAVLGNVLITGGTITGGVANCGGNIYNNGTLTIEDGLITLGQVKGSNACGGNLYVGMVRNTTTKEIYPSVTMSGGTISDGKAAGTGGNIQTHSEFTMTGGLISGGTASSAGSIRVFRPGIFVLDGGTISGGTATSNGGVFQVVGNIATTSYSQVGVLNIISGKIVGGSAKNGGTISVEHFGVLNMEGGTVEGGTASECGGTIYVNSVNDGRPAVVNISGGEIVNGTAATGNGIYITDVKGGGVTVNADAKFSGEGANLYVDNAAQTNLVFNQLSGADTLIVVDAADKAVAFATADADYSNYMICDDSDYLVTYAEGGLSFVKDTTVKVAAVYEGENELAKYASLEDAIAAAGNGYVKLLTDITTDYTLTGTVWIDLNGFDLTGITVTGALYGIDSTTEEYDDSNVGTLSATVVGEGAIASNCKTTAEMLGAVKRYLAVPGENGTYTFHRFYLGISALSIKPDSYGVGYKALFLGDDFVKAYLSQTQAYGYHIWLDGGNKLTRAFDADQFGVKDTLTLRINNFLDSAKDLTFNEERANMPVNANVFIKLSTGEIIETDTAAYSFKDMTELAAANYENYTESQQAALNTLGTQFEELMFRWAIPFVHHAGEGWTAWKNASEVPVTSGKYYLDCDVNTSTTVKIAPDQDITLCLNGHKVNASTRIYYVSGTLSICDCCHNKAPEEQGYMIGNGTGMAPIMYTYYGSTVNLYSGNLTATKQVSQGGVLAVANDQYNQYSVPQNAHDTVFNMYGGKIYGGNVTGKGGNIITYHGGTFNMYGGEIYGGTAGDVGGNFCISSSNSDTGNIVLNIYGGVIRDGVSGTNGGNIYGGNKSEVHIYGGQIADGVSLGYGGNICMIADELHMEGGTVSGGKASDGGNIMMPNAASTNITLNGGIITGGKAERHGGNLYMVNKGTFTFNNMTVSNGYAGGNGGNMYLYTDMDVANYTEEEFDVLLHNCTVIGGTADDLGDSIYAMEVDLTISGNTQIQNANGQSLFLDAGEKVILKDLTDSAKIYVSMSIPGTLSDDTAYLNNVYADDAAMDVQIVNGGIKLIDEATSATVPNLTGFSVGWHRGVITPSEPMPLDGMGNNVGRMDKWEIKTELEAGVTVIADNTGIENAIVLVSVDTLFIQKELSDNLCQAISDATGIAKNRIFFSASHSHSGVDHDALYEATRNYLEWFYPTMTSYVVKAVEDLAPATIQTASIDVVSTDGNSLNLSRRYIGDDGNAYSSVDSSKSYAPPSGAERESASDPEMQLIRFVRDGKTDVVMSNWQAHPTGWASADYGRVSAENWKYFRESVEKQLDDTVCTFFLGAAGNLGNNTSTIRSSFKSVDGKTYAAYVSGSTQKTLEGMGDLMASYAVYALNNSVTDVKSGALKVTNHTFETENYYFTDKDTYKADMSQYKAIDMDLNAITIGDSIAFVTAPYEMFHENGQQIKAYAQDLGIDTCFVLTNSMGENKYIGSNNAFANDSTDGAYSSFGVRTCRFVQGTAEALIDQYADMLAQLKGIEACDSIYQNYTVNVVDTNGNPVQNVMVELVGGGYTRNCSDADGTVVYYVYDGIDYAVNIVKLPAGYTYSGSEPIAFDADRTVTIAVEETK